MKYPLYGIAKAPYRTAALFADSNFTYHVVDDLDELLERLPSTSVCSNMIPSSLLP